MSRILGFWLDDSELIKSNITLHSVCQLTVLYTINKKHSNIVHNYIFRLHFKKLALIDKNENTVREVLGFLIRKYSHLLFFGDSLGNVQRTATRSWHRHHEEETRRFFILNDDVLTPLKGSVTSASYILPLIAWQRMKEVGILQRVNTHLNKWMHEWNRLVIISQSEISWTTSQSLTLKMMWWLMLEKLVKMNESISSVWNAPLVNFVQRIQSLHGIALLN